MNDTTPQTKTIQRPLTVGQYTPTAAFRAIQNHSCVCYADDRGLVALTGPADDIESQKYADLFSAAPDLLEVCKAMIALDSLKDVPKRHALRMKINAAIAKAEGATSPEVERPEFPDGEFPNGQRWQGGAE
jgi:hypothetical protein